MLLLPTLPCLSAFGVFLAVPSSDSKPHWAPSQGLASGISIVQCTVQAAGTSEGVASFDDAFTSVSMLAKSALAGDVTAAAEFILCVFYSFHGSVGPSFLWPFYVVMFRVTAHRRGSLLWTSAATAKCCKIPQFEPVGL